MNFLATVRATLKRKINANFPIVFRRKYSSFVISGLYRLGSDENCWPFFFHITRNTKPIRFKYVVKTKRKNIRKDEEDGVSPPPCHDSKRRNPITPAGEEDQTKRETRNIKRNPKAKATGNYSETRNEANKTTTCCAAETT